MELDELINQKNDSQQRRQERQALASDIGAHMKANMPKPEKAEITVHNQPTKIELSVRNDDVKVLEKTLEDKISSLGDSIERAILKLNLEIPESQKIEGKVDTGLSTKIMEGELKNVSDGIIELLSEIEKLPRELKVNLPKIEIPKTMTIGNVSVLTESLSMINRNIEALAKTIKNQTITAPEFPEVTVDIDPVVRRLEKLEKAFVSAISNIRFPVSNSGGSTQVYKNTKGENVSVVLDANGNVPTSLNNQAASVTVIDAASSTSVGGNLYFNNTLTATVVNVKTSAGNVYFIEASNPNVGDVFIQMFNSLAVNVTLGTTPPVWSFLIPAGANAMQRGARDFTFKIPPSFNTAISIAATTTPTGAIAAASNLTANIEYL